MPAYVEATLVLECYAGVVREIFLCIGPMRISGAQILLRDLGRMRAYGLTAVVHDFAFPCPY